MHAGLQEEKASRYSSTVIVKTRTQVQQCCKYSRSKIKIIVDNVCNDIIKLVYMS